MSTFAASQTLRPPSQAAALSAPARLTAAHAVPPPAQAAALDVYAAGPPRVFGAAQVVPAPAQRAKVRNPPLYGPAEPRPPGVPATPRPL